jgi:hypothetical protein
VGVSLFSPTCLSTYAKKGAGERWVGTLAFFDRKKEKAFSEGYERNCGLPL